MADDYRGAELPRRVPGAARAGPAAPAAPALTENVWQRMQAAVQAERAEAVPEQERAGRWPATAVPVPRRLRPLESVTSSEAGLATGFPARGADGNPEGAAAAPAVWPGPEKTRRRAGARLVALGLAAVLLGSLAAVAVTRSSSSPGNVRAQAAAWVAGQVSPDVTVSCDAAMCSALKADGFPAGKLVVLGPASPDPVRSVLVVETAAVREMFGDSLAVAWAPAVLASFGSGTGAISVRVVAPHGAAAYRASLNASLASGKTAGVALADDPRVTVSATARSQLVAGQVDPRLLLALTSVARQQPIDIVRFGNFGPGASPGVPLRFADLAENVPAARMSTAAYVRSAWAVLSGPGARVRPARAVSGPVQGQAILRVEFTAPSPLGPSGSASP